MNSNKTAVITPLYGKYNWLFNPIGQLVKVGEEGEITARFCSGFNISNNGYFLTAGHCISDDNVCSTNTDLSDTRVSFTYQCQPSRDMRMCNVSLYEPTYGIQRVVAQGFCSYTAEAGLDYAVLSLDPRASAYGYLGLSTAKPLLWDDIACVQHPLGKVKQYSVGKIMEVADNLIDHAAHTYGGSSGSPVVSLSTNKVIALHVAGSVDQNRQPDQKHHYAVPTQRILQSALQHREQWPITIGLFAPAKNAGKTSIKLHDKSASLTYKQNKPGCFS